MHNNEKKANIICLSNQLWSYPLWTNKRHVMTRLGKRGFNVIFVDPPINVGRLFFKHLLAGKWSLKRLFSLVYTDSTVTIFSPLNFVPIKGYLSKFFANKITKLAAKKFDPNLKTILWVYHVEMDGLQELIDNVKHDVLVYDCVDNYSAFPKHDTQAKKDKIIMQEEVLAKRADIVFATAPGLVDRLARLNPKTFYTPNVGDFERFNKAKDYAESIPEDISGISRPRVVFAGAVDEYKFDKELVKKIARDYQSYSFVIIGPAALKDREASAKELGFEGIDNIYFLGTRPYDQMPKYFAATDVFIIPYQLNDYTVGGCFPVKFHEALAAGLPVVVTDLPAYRSFSDVCYISKSTNDFSQNVRRALEENNDQRRKDRIVIAKANDWEGKVDRMIELIDSEVSNL
jgi:glycosyltransferase involved in cell wall biosynthesis